MTHLAREQSTIDTADLEPPLQRLTSEQPNIPIENVDVTRQSIAFGRWAIPKLVRIYLTYKQQNNVIHLVM